MNQKFPHRLLVSLCVVSFVFFNNASLALAAPGGVQTDLGLWLKANAGVFSDAGTTAAIDGVGIQEWQDQSSAGIDATEATNSNQRPTFQSDAANLVNFNPSVLFDGSNDRFLLDSNSIALGNTSYSFRAVSTVGTNSNGNAILGSAGTGTRKSTLLELNAGSPPQVFSFWQATNLSADATNVDNDDIVIVGDNYDNTVGRTVFSNGLQIGSNANTSHSATDGLIKVGEFSTTGSTADRFTGRMMEVIAYSNTKSSTELNRIDAYLALKYGITLDQAVATAYLASDGSTKMWDETVNATYNNDIFGIGRDDGSNLDQRVSKSLNDDAILTVALDNDFTSANNDASRTTAFGSDLSFLMFANNNGAATFAIAGTNQVLDRVWQVQEEGTVGSVQLQFDMDDADFDIATLDRYELLVDTDNDADFSDETPVSMTNTTGSLWSTSFDFTDGQLFTVALGNAAPTDIALDGGNSDTIIENTVANTDIGTLTTTDSDVADTHAYSLACSVAGADDSHFAIVGDKLQNTTVFDYETPVDANTDNSYEVCVRVTDSGVGNATYDEILTVAVQDIVDETPPVISETTPVDTPTNDSTPSYTFTTDEAGTITYGGSCSSATTAAVFGPNTVDFNTLAEGPYTDCTITVTDAASNVSNQITVSSFTIDTTAPTTTPPSPGVTTPSSGPVNAIVTIPAGSCGADYANGTAIWNTNPAGQINPHPTTVSLDASGDYPQTVLDTSGSTGTFDLTLTCTDQAGNPGPTLDPAVGGFTADHVAPVIGIDSPLMGDDIFNATEAGTVTISGSTDAENGQTVSVSVGTVSGNTTASSGTWSLVLDLSGEANGSLAITADVSDIAGNAATQATASITKDAATPTTTPPTPGVTTPTAGPVGATVTIPAGSCGADYANGTAIWNTNPAGQINPHPTTVSLDASGDYPQTVLDTSGSTGTFDLTLTCTDQAGNPGPTLDPAVGGFTADHVAPVIGIDSPLMGDDIFNATEAGTVTISGSTDAENGQTVSVSVGTVSGNTTASSGTWSLVLDLSGEANGSLAITADVSDIAGNAATQATASITKDAATPTTTPPTPGVTTPTAGPVGATVTIPAGSCGADYANGTAIWNTNPAGQINPHPTTVSLDASGDYPQTVLDTSGSTGTFDLTLTCTDQAGNPGPTLDPAVGGFTADHVAPVIGIDSPLMGDDIFNATEAGTVTISGSTDAENGQTVSVSVGTVSGNTTASSGTWSLVLDLSGEANGSLAITADVSDIAGNAATQATASITKDAATPTTTPPTPGVTTPTAGPVGATVTIPAGSCGADYANGTAIWNTNPAGQINPHPTTVSLDASGDYPQTVLDTSGSTGTFDLTLTCTDQAGNPGPTLDPAVGGFTADHVAPVIGIDSPLMGDDIFNATEAGTVTISGSTDAENGQTVSVSVGTVSGNTTASSGTWSLVLDLSGEANGSLAITADVSDIAGNAATQATASITKDAATPTTTPPTPGVTTPTAGPVGATVTIPAGSCGADYANGTAIWNTNPAGQINPHPTTVSLDASGDYPQTVLDTSGSTGTFDLTLTCTDQAGNPGPTLDPAVGGFTADHVAPVIGIDSPLMGDDIFNATEAGTVTISGSTDAENGQTVSVSVGTVSGNTTASSGTWSLVLDLSGEANGSLAITADVSDIAGNAATQATASITKDAATPTTTPPTPGVTTPTAGPVGATVTIPAGSCGADYANGTAIWNTNPAGQINPHPTTVSLDASGDYPQTVLDTSGSTGTFDLTLTCTDQAGNPGPTLDPAVGGFTADHVAPVIGIDSPLMGDDIFNATEAGTVTISGSTDAENGQTVSVSVGTVSGNTTASSGTWSLVLDLSGEANGSLAITADVSDIAGNAATQATASITKDAATPTTTPPTPGVTTPTAGPVGATVTIPAGSCGADYANGTAIWNTNPAGQINPHPTTVSLDASGDYPQTVLDTSGSTGTFDLTLTCTDQAGNPGPTLDPAVGGFTADHVAPVIGIDSPLMGDDIFNATEAGTVTISGSTDAENGQTVSVSVGTVSGNTTASSGTWSLVLDLSGEANGSLAITADVSDIAGNAATQATASITKDAATPTTTPPTPGVTTPTAGPVGATVTIPAGSCGADYANGTAIWNTNPAGQINPHPTTVSLDASGDYPQTVLDTSGSTGTFDLTLTCTDQAGNPGPTLDPAVGGFTADHVAPVIGIDSPLMGDDIFNATEAGTVTISGSTDAENGQTVSVSVGTVSGNTTASSGTWSLVLDLSGEANGSLAITADVSDIAGNAATQATASITKDAATPTTTPPTPGVTTPTAGPVGATVTIPAGSCGADYANGTAIWNTNPAGQINPHPTTVSLDASGDYPQTVLDTSGSTGTFDLTLTCTDQAGNPGPTLDPAVGGFTADHVAPVIGIDSPLMGDDIFNATEAGTVTISGSTDAENGQTVSVSVGTVSGNTTASSGTWSLVLDLSGEANGSLAITADVSDIAGNAATQATASITKDAATPTTTPPTPGVTTPTAGPVGATVTIPAGSCGADYANGTAIWNTNPAGQINPHPTTVSLDASGDYPQTVLDTSGSTGTFDLTLTCTDQAGNPGPTLDPAVGGFTADHVAPVIGIDSPLMGDDIFNATEAGTVTISGSTDAENGQTVSVSVGTVSGNTTASSGTWSLVLDLSGEANGSLAITADVSDIAGNAATQATASITKDAATPTTTPPTPGVTTPTAGPVGATVTIPAGSCGADYANGTAIWNTNPAGQINPHPTTVSLDASGDYPQTVLDTSGSTGTFDLTLTCTDQAGNPGPTLDPAVGGFTADLSKPTPPVVYPITTTTDPITGTSEPGSIITVSPLTCDNTPVVTDTSGNWSCDVTTSSPLTALTTIDVTATDSAGNVSDPTMTTVVDHTTTTVPPTVDPTDGDPVTGTGEPGALITVKDNLGNILCQTSVFPNGTFICSPVSPAPSPGDTLEVTQNIAPNGESAPTELMVIDPTAVVLPPTISPTDGDVITGTAEPNATVRIIDPTSGLTLCTATADGSGNFSCDLSPDLTDGQTVNVTATVDGTSSLPTTITVDSSDSDGDGIDNTDETGAINGGDGNGDGTPDDEQTSVTSVTNPVTSQPVTMSVTGGNCRVIDGYDVEFESTQTAQDSAFDYPIGLFDFELYCTNVGQSTDVTFYLDKEYDTTGWVWRKINRSAGVYSTFNETVTYGTATIGTDTVTTVNIVVADNNSDDEDSTANARILDPSGPALPAPTSSGSGGGGGSAPIRHIITMCSYDTGKCENIFPTGNDETYKTYRDCYQSGSKSGTECATEWALAKNYVAVEDFVPTTVQPAQTGSQAEEISTSGLEESKSVISDDGRCETITYRRYPGRRGSGASAGLFGDTLETHAAYPYLVDLNEQNIVNGDAETGNARLDSEISRAEVMKIMTIARQDSLKQGECAELTTFPDVNTGAWYHHFVQNMEQQDIVHGYNDGLYRPGKNIIKAEIYKILALSFGYITYDEAKQIAAERGIEWYVPYIEALENNVALPSAIRAAEPGEGMTRGEMFTMLSLVLQKVDEL